MSENDFLGFLVDETLKLQQKGEMKLSSLELKLNDYALNFIKGEFIPQSQVLRFKSQFGHLDFPVNWSIFKMEDNPGTVLDKDHDIDFLFSVIRKAWNPEFSKILVINADGFCYLVGLKNGDETHLHDLLNPQEWLKAG